MEILVLTHDYGLFLDWLYDKNPQLAGKSYSKQKEVRANSLFGVSYFYPEAFQKRGHNATGIYINNKYLQQAWKREYANTSSRNTHNNSLTSYIDSYKNSLADTFATRFVPTLRSVLGDEFVRPAWFYGILKKQFEYYDPDIVLNLSVPLLSSNFLDEMKEKFEFTIIGQITSPIPDWIDLSVYDLMISALPSFVSRFEQMGIPSKYIKLAFEPTINEKIASKNHTIPVSFVGKLSKEHTSRVQLLETIASQVPLQVWGPRIDHLPSDSPIRECYQGQAWGRKMYEIYNQSKIVVNNHIDVAGQYAANARMYEATGVGSLLITDHKSNLNDIFEVGNEVIAYDSAQECAELIQHYLTQTRKRENIAKNGQDRTINNHTYIDRVDKIIEFINGHE